MTTMLEVAKRAGVSKATVSRVLSGNGYVSQETKDRVFQAIEESGYRPNLLARNLATKRTQTLGLVVTNTLYHGVYFSELLFHAARMTEEKGRQLILADGKHSADEEREAIQYLLDMRCDAVIIYPRFLSVDEMDEIVEKCEQPIMVLNRRLRKNSSHCVWSDHKASCQDAVSQLIAKGHREIAFITGSLDSPPGLSVFPATKTRWRSTVFRCARADCAGEVEPGQRRGGGFRTASRGETLRRWWRAMTIWPSAP
jgi:LacI family asc operon transcriptional repressor